MNVVHVGYPKTGTTFFQWNVFPRLKNWNFIDYHQCHEVFMDLIYLDDLDYDESKVRNLLAQYIQSGDNLASYEALTGAPFTFKGLNRSNVPVRLKRLGFDRIILTIRDQSSILDSLYRQYVVQGGVLKFKDFLNLEGKWNPYLRPFNLDYLKYDRLIATYQNVFGEENVLVIRQEWLKQKPELVTNELSAFLNESVSLLTDKSANPSLTNISVKLLRILNHFTFNSQKPNHLITNHFSSKNFWKLFVVVFDPYLFRFFSSKQSFLKGTDLEVVRRYFEESNGTLDQILSKR